jgi:hypothetical protein
MTNKELKELNDLNLADNNAKKITAEKLRELTTEFVKSNGSFADYNNSSVTHQNITAGVWTKLTNNGLGTLTETSYKPYYCSSMFSGDEVRLANIPLGTVVTLRLDNTITVLSNNTNVTYRVKFKDSLGATVYTSEFDFKHYKNATTVSSVSLYNFYIGDAILDGSISLEVNAENNITALWNGCLITIP